MDMLILGEIELPAEFFTRESVLTFSGMVAATYAVCNALQRVFNFNPRWLALAVAVVLCLVGTYTRAGSGVPDYLLALVNGCLVFLTVAGASQVPAVVRRQMPAQPGPPGAEQAQKRRFFSPWF